MEGIVARISGYAQLQPTRHSHRSQSPSAYATETLWFRTSDIHPTTFFSPKGYTKISSGSTFSTTILKLLTKTRTPIAHYKSTYLLQGFRIKAQLRVACAGMGK